MIIIFIVKMKREKRAHRHSVVWWALRRPIASIGLVLCVALLGPAVGCRRAPRVALDVHTAERVVTAGGAITEIVFALGAGAHVVGVDTSSTWPTEVSRLPQVGYQRALAAEPLLSLRPTLVIATADAGPPEVLARLRAAGVRVVITTAAHGLTAACERVRAVGEALGRRDESEALAVRMRNDVLASPRVRSEGLRVVFVYARGGGTLNVAGRDTAADAMIHLVGAHNPVEGYAGYRPLTAEALAAAAPDVLLFSTSGLASIGGASAALALPGVATTPAGRARRVVALDDLLLLGFGPRTAEAARTLATRLSP
jgi:iron complex transport system substrate-binding protein